MNQQVNPADSVAPEPWDGFSHANGLPAVPIVIGIVGHRGINAEDGKLKNRLKEVFQQFRNEYSATPLVVLSALADGADQVAAWAALESGAFVRAPLPFPPDIYSKSTSFNGHKSREKLSELLEHQRVEWFVVPLPDGMANPDTDWLRVATDRADEPIKRLRYACYANAGGYIARRCNILIALWDERDQGRSRGPSGTADYVAFKLNGRAPSYYPWTFAEPLGFRNERRLVMVIDTPRTDPAPIAVDGGSQSVRSVGHPNVLVPNDEGERCCIPTQWLPLPRRVSSWSRFWSRAGSSLGFILISSVQGSPERRRLRKMKEELRQFRETCTNVDDFNRDVVRPEVERAIRRRLEDETKKLHAKHFDAQHNHWLLRLSRIREAAASLSGFLQPQHDRALLFVLGLLGLGVLAFHLYAHWFGYNKDLGHTEHDPVYLGVFLTLLVAAAAIVMVDWWTRLDERRLDSRALAEALRVRRAWSMAGLSGSVADTYSEQIRSEMSWIRQAVLHVCPPPTAWADQFSRLLDDEKLELLADVRSEWVKGQLRQHEAAHKKQHEAATNLRRAGFGLAVVGWGILVALLLSSWWAPTTEHREASGRTQHALTASAVLDEGQVAFRVDHTATVHAPLSATYPPHWILILASSLVIAGGLCIAYCERQAYEELSKQYERMAILFANGDRELKDRITNRDIVGSQRVIEALGREAIIEHAQWLILRRSRQLELHIGG